VSGLPANRKAFATALLPHVDHLRHTQELDRSAFSRGQPELGAELADELENRIIARNDGSTIAAVIVEPVSGAGGVLIPPRGYLRRLREICTRHGIVLIFDEVICGFGRLGTPFAAQHFDVMPDLITFAKAVTSGAAPLGGVLVRREIHDTFMQASPAGIEFFHGYTYSGHPLACAAGHGALDTYEQEDLFARGADLAPSFEDGLHAFRDGPNVIDCRNLGLIGAIELAPRPGAPGARATEAATRAWDLGAFVRPIGDALAFCPPLSTSREQLDRLFGIVREALKTVA
jgi:beta-alanine--pyruvate transaminase